MFRADICTMSIDIEKPAIQPINQPFLKEKKIEIYVKRLDLIHPEVGGNKWYKLRYNIEKAIAEETGTLLTFGGAWSNHIYATASAGKLLGIKTIGMIRGEEPVELSTTLKHARACGMQLEFITRMAYEEKDTEDFKSWLRDQYGSFHLVPEGGSNYLGVNGCMEILEPGEEAQYDFICCAGGTGAMAAGILMSLSGHAKLLCFPALKGGEFLEGEIRRMIGWFTSEPEVVQDYMSPLQLITDYHFGGYGKWNQELIDFIFDFESKTGVPLDQIYTGKMMYGILDLAGKGFFPDGSRVLVVHSGGLQGRESLGL